MHKWNMSMFKTSRSVCGGTSRIALIKCLEKKYGLLVSVRFL